MIYVISPELFNEFMEGVCGGTLHLDSNGEVISFILPNGDMFNLVESPEGFELQEVGLNAGRFIIHHHITYD